MDTSVNINTESLKASLKRNTIGRSILSVVIITIVGGFIYWGIINCMTAFIILAVLLIISQVTNYYLGISLLIDQAVFAIRKRGQTNV